MYSAQNKRNTLSTLESNGLLKILGEFSCLDPKKRMPTWDRNDSIGLLDEKGNWLENQKSKYDNLLSQLKPFYNCVFNGKIDDLTTKIRDWAEQFPQTGTSPKPHPIWSILNNRPNDIFYQRSFELGSMNYVHHYLTYDNASQYSCLLSKPDYMFIVHKRPKPPQPGYSFIPANPLSEQGLEHGRLLYSIEGLNKLNLTDFDGRDYQTSRQVRMAEVLSPSLQISEWDSVIVKKPISRNSGHEHSW